MTKELCHGLPLSRAKSGHDAPGISPDPATIRLLLGVARNATQYPPNGEGVNRRSDVSGTAPEQDCKGRGWIKASGEAADPRHGYRVDTVQGSAGTSSVYRGEVAGGGAVSKRKVKRMTIQEQLNMVPMPLFLGGGMVAGGGYAFALWTRSTHTKEPVHPSCPSFVGKSPNKEKCKKPTTAQKGQEKTSYKVEWDAYDIEREGSKSCVENIEKKVDNKKSEKAGSYAQTEYNKSNYKPFYVICGHLQICAGARFLCTFRFLHTPADFVKLWFCIVGHGTKPTPLFASDQEILLSSNLGTAKNGCLFWTLQEAVN